MFKAIVRNIIPHAVYEWLHDMKGVYYVLTAKKMQKKALKRLKGKERLRCVFFALFDEVWKYDGVYRLMSSNPRFEPIVLVCPVVNYGKDNMLNRMDKCYKYFKSKGYNVIKSYNPETDEYIDVYKELAPDLIFYTNPYEGLIDMRYYIDKFRDVLTVYVPYFFGESVNYKVAYNNLFSNLVWRKYVETVKHRAFAIKYADNKGVNTCVVGYPGIEALIDKGYVASYKDWKLGNNVERKRIIWAPHHTLEAVGTCHYSCFLMYCDFMIKMAEKYSDKIQIVFKPHPLLRNKLNEIWGVEKTTLYYSKWEEMPNTALKEGDYEDLFLTSDAMIHDSGSFLIEYLYTNKPVMRTLNDIPLEKMYNPFALECLNHYYFANNDNDIEIFIQNVINGVDSLKEQRTKFVNEVLMPKGSPSQNIIDDILDSIDNQILYRN